MVLIGDIGSTLALFSASGHGILAVEAGVSGRLASCRRKRWRYHEREKFGTLCYGRFFEWSASDCTARTGRLTQR